MAVNDPSGEKPTMFQQGAPWLPPAIDAQEDRTKIRQVLNARGSKYGVAADQFSTSQEFKRIVRRFENKLDPVQLEALDMVVMKISRILHGDPNYADSWVDIAGYAQLEADRLNGVHR